MVALADEPVGFLYWRKVPTSMSSFCWNIGIALLPEARARGHGGPAQRLLAERLFATSAANRGRIEGDLFRIERRNWLQMTALHFVFAVAFALIQLAAETAIYLKLSILTNFLQKSFSLAFVQMPPGQIGRKHKPKRIVDLIADLTRCHERILRPEPGC